MFCMDRRTGDIQIFIRIEISFSPHSGETATDSPRPRLSSYLCYEMRQCTAPQAVCPSNVTPHYVCQNIAQPDKTCPFHSEIEVITWVFFQGEV